MAAKPKIAQLALLGRIQLPAKNKKIVHKNAQSRTTTHEKYEANPKNGGIARPSNITPK
jgi:hypothetical protein